MGAMQKLSVSFSLMATIDKPLVPGMPLQQNTLSLVIKKLQSYSSLLLAEERVVVYFLNQIT
jgi:hypothetical protein